MNNKEEESNSKEEILNFFNSEIEFIQNIKFDYLIIDKISRKINNFLDKENQEELSKEDINFIINNMMKISKMKKNIFDIFLKLNLSLFEKKVTKKNSIEDLKIIREVFLNSDIFKEEKDFYLDEESIDQNKFTGLEEVEKESHQFFP